MPDLDVLTIFTLLIFMTLTMVAFRDLLIIQRWLSIALIVYLISGFLGVLVEVIHRISIDFAWLEKSFNFESAQNLGLIAALIIMPFMFLNGLWNFNVPSNHLKHSKKTDIDRLLDFSRSVGKRLDEHRELVEAIQIKTELLSEDWYVDHLATQDDYFMRLYFMRHGEWPLNDLRNSNRQPTNEIVRPRPRILGDCKLPEFTQEN